LEKTFILGVGAQKGGTTWLHGQLDACRNIDFGFRKEYHTFDSIGDSGPYKTINGSTNGFRDHRIKKILKLHEAGKLGKNLGPKRKKSKHTALELAFMDNTNHYFDYFDYLYLKDPKVEAVGDITPNYAILSPKTFRHIKRGLKERGFTVKVLFLMRDPVERAWSLARMRRRNLRQENQLNFDELNHIISAPENDCINTKSRYENTIRSLEKAFNPKNIYYGFYETLFNSNSHNAIQNFLGINLQPFGTSEIFNASPKTVNISLELNQELVPKFMSTYEYILKRFGPSMRTIWQGYNFIK
jgi:hypothetical protein